jgi:hypothetical protein
MQQVICSSNIGETNVQLAISALDSIQKSSDSSFSLSTKTQFVISSDIVFI